MESNTLPPDGVPPLPVIGPSKDERTMAMLCHLLAFSGFIIPGASIIGPLILWHIKKDTMPFVNEHGKEALNFNITFGIFAVVCFLTFWLFLPILVLVAGTIGAIVLIIIASIKASEGKSYSYPFTLRLVK